MSTRTLAVIKDVVGGIAPEIDLDGIDPAAGFRDQLDIDSVDFLNFLVGLHRELGVEVPESDYRRLRSLNDLVGYLDAKLAGK